MSDWVDGSQNFQKLWLEKTEVIKQDIECRLASLLIELHQAGMEVIAARSRFERAKQEVEHLKMILMLMQQCGWD